MSNKEQIIKIVKCAVQRYSKNLNNYKLRVNNNYPTERNITSNIGISFFLEHGESAKIFQEVPFSNKYGGKYKYHIDTYLACDRYSVMVEAKNYWKNKEERSLLKDALRVSKKYPREQIISRHKNENSPPEAYALIVTQIMSEKWKSRWDKLCKSTDSNVFNSKWDFGIEDASYKDGENGVSLWISWAIRKLPSMT